VEPVEPEILDFWVNRLSPLVVDEPPNEKMFHARDPQVVAERLMLFFESGDNLKKHLRTHAGFAPNSTQAADIAACLSQAREFLRISRAADLSIRPITLYYGMASLAKALVLSFGNPKLLASLPPSHGLKAPSTFGVPMESLEVRADGNDGLFHRFVDSLSNREHMIAEIRKVGKLRIWTKLSDSSQLPGFRASLKSLLTRIEGLEDFFRETFDETPMNAPVEFHLARFGADQKESESWNPQASLVFRLPKGEDENWVRSLHPRLREWRFRDDTGNLGDRLRGVAVFENLPPKLSPRPSGIFEQGPLLRHLSGLTIPLTRGVQGDFRLIASVGDITIPEPAIQLAAAFLLSTIARYRPDIWSAFSGFSPDQKDSRLRALIEAFLDRASSIFPLQVLASLARTSIVVWDGRPVMFA
jgi:YaaC-like Protein